MSDSELNSFAKICRKLRAERGLYLADQALALKISVPYVSAIELGRRPIPPDYVANLSRWLHLTGEDNASLEKAAAGTSNVIQFRPKDRETAELAFGFAKRLNELSPQEIIELGKMLKVNDDAY